MQHFNIGGIFSIEGYDVLAAKDEGILHDVLDLPHIAVPGIPEKSFQDVSGYRFNGFLECDNNTSVACNTISTQIHNYRLVSSCRKYSQTLLKRKTLRFSVHWA